MRTVNHYGLHGLSVSSPVPLPAVPHVDGVAGGVEVLVQDVAVLACEEGGGAVVADVRDEASGRAYTLRRHGSEWSMRLHGAAHCRFVRPAAGAVTTVEIQSVVPDDLLAVLVAGPVMTAVAVASGGYVLHASAVARPDGTTWAFTAPRGGGKSTVAALLSTGGRLLMSDDALAIRVESGAVHAWPGTVRPRLRPGTPVGTEDARRTADGRLVPWVPTVGTAAARPVTRLCQVVLDHRATLSTLVPLVGLDALTVLLAGSPLDGVQGSLLEEQFARSAEVVEVLDVAELRVAWRGGDTDLAIVRDELVGLLEAGDTRAR